MESSTLQINELPLDVQIEIARYLPLRDALSFSQAYTLAFDAVYYVFAHRDFLDLTSVLDVNETIDLQDEILLNILRAHTRASTIVNFSLSSNFSMFSELEEYFTLYWHHCVNTQGHI